MYALRNIVRVKCEDEPVKAITPYTMKGRKNGFTADLFKGEEKVATVRCLRSDEHPVECQWASKKARREFIDFMLVAPSVEAEDRPEGVHPDSHMVDEQFIGVHLEKVGTKGLALARLSVQA